MKVLIVAATKIEILPFLAKQKSVDHLITGVGVPACLFTLTQQLATQHYDFVIQAGVAGSYVNATPLACTYYVISDVFADVGIKEKDRFNSLFDVGFANPNQHPFSNGLLLNKVHNNFGLLPVRAITVNTITDDIVQNELLSKKYNAEIESMEGAAMHYVCLQKNVPFLQIRSTSNYVGERNKKYWKLDQAIQILNDDLIKIVDTLLANK